MALGSLLAAAVLAMLRLETDRSTSSGRDRPMNPAGVPVPDSAR
jgi:hypothetical protein